MTKDRADFLVKLVLTAAAAFFVFHFAAIGGFVKDAFSFLQPVLIGLVFAAAMRVPLRFFERKLFARIRKEKLRECLSVGLTFVVFGGALTALCLLVVPQLTKSVKEIASILASDPTDLLSGVKGIEKLRPLLQKAVDFLRPRVVEYVPKIVDFLQSALTGLYNVLFGIVVAVMLVLNRKNVKKQFDRVLSALFSAKKPRVRAFLLSATEKFCGYLGGQLTEAFILGSACFLTFSLLKIPYAALVSLIIGFMNLIPIFGAYVGGFLCGVVVFAAAPEKLLVFVVSLLILQQIEGFTTYPIVVGKYVGLNGFWTTVAIIVWGGLLGFWGLFLGVPLTAFLFDLFEKKMDKKEEENKLLVSLTEDGFAQKRVGKKRADRDGKDLPAEIHE